MKNLWRICCSLLGSLTVFIFCGSVYASTYLGEVCWLVDDSQQGEEDFIIKLAVTDAGDNHFTVNGIELSTEGAPSSNGEVLNGNAEVVGSEVVFSLSSAYNDSEETATIQYFVTIATATLNGTYSGIATIYDKLDKVTFTGYGTGSVTRVDCP